MLSSAVGLLPPPPKDIFGGRTGERLLVVEGVHEAGAGAGERRARRRSSLGPHPPVDDEAAGVDEDFGVGVFQQFSPHFLQKFLPLECKFDGLEPLADQIEVRSLYAHAQQPVHRVVRGDRGVQEFVVALVLELQGFERLAPGREPLGPRLDAR